MEIGVIFIIIHTNVGKTARDRAKPSVSHAKRKPTMMGMSLTREKEIIQHKKSCNRWLNRWVLVGAGGYCWVLVGTGGYNRILVGSAGYWWVLVGTGGY